MIPSLNSLQPPDHGASIDAVLTAEARVAESAQGSTAEPEDDSSWPLPKAQLISRVASAYNESSTFLDQHSRPSWQRSVKAYRNEHFAGSKYQTPEWSNRSKVFKPKTRAAVRKQMDAAAKALFSSPDVVTLKASNESDDIQRASAGVKQHLLNYRLDRATGKAAVPWFLISMGACQDAALFGICVSLQSWKFKKDRRDKTLHDRPEIELYPPEDVLIEPTANWINPEQNAGYLFLCKPTTVDDLMGLTESTSAGGIQWLHSGREQLEQAAARAQQANKDQSASVRSAREGGNDPRDTASRGPAPRLNLMTCFMRIKGEEYVFWMLNGRELLSAPAYVDEIYPWNGGERPVAWGYGTIDTHRILPMSKVESLQPLQQEANDITNLRLDLMKQAAYPLTKVLRGRNVDTVALARRGPNQQIFVQSHDDLEFDRPPEVPTSAYQESNYINADFDDLAGNFSGSSVQTNRSLNETVGGMRLLASSAASVGEFDTQVWVMTWVEKVLAQIVRLQAMYESDERILIIAGERAKLMQKFGIDVVTDEMLATEATVSVNVGANATDPMARLQKLEAAGTLVATFLEREFESGKVKINPRAVVDEVFGGAGYTDAGDRFFTFKDEEGQQGQGGGQPQQDPAQMMLQMKLKEIEANAQIEMQKAQSEAARKDVVAKADIARKDAIAQADIARKDRLSQVDMQLDAQAATARHRIAESESMLRAMREDKSLERKDSISAMSAGRKAAMAENDQRTKAESKEEPGEKSESEVGAREMMAMIREIATAIKDQGKSIEAGMKSLASAERD